MDTHDRRVKRTQNLLARALIALTLEKGYESVTIRDITEQADVGYATFFRHYHDKDALLEDVLNVVLADLIDLLHPAPTEADPATLGTLIFRYVQEHSEVVRVVLRSRWSSTLLQHAIETGISHVLQQHPPREGSPVPIEIAAYHIVTSSIALIQWWLEHDMPYPPEQMGTIYSELIARPTNAIAFDS
ncbi:TetR/AcrR family transcriptional regulator [Ktedonosporobacter rubrisoli]|uniref:TetR/AcrR family transcriptional regulator n=1 Tax=Ktedonosporobacter rubrisoli TaxID=2509675 RepID=A0A4P6JQ99_KTERU|nr:TetR/AcrR family transcriptional regulator [Ktedonosporobacter rubrisoli]QBD77588.1 TetR/AcrR family transcriptional regulator [Ktedonosporobacter rubrisoli]